jgi:hypothetical protein
VCLGLNAEERKRAETLEGLWWERVSFGGQTRHQALID